MARKALNNYADWAYYAAQQAAANGLWISNTQITAPSSSGTSIQFPYGVYNDPARGMVKPKTAVDWLRERVEDITKYAFSEVVPA